MFSIYKLKQQITWEINLITSVVLLGSIPGSDCNQVTFVYPLDVL